MPDLADSACPHFVRTIQDDVEHGELQYLCMDCGTVHARLLGVDRAPSAIRLWGARAGIPGSQVERYIRRLNEAVIDLLDEIERAG